MNDDRKFKLQETVSKLVDIEIAVKYADLFLREKEQEVLKELLDANDLIKVQSKYRAYVEFREYVEILSKQHSQAKKQLIKEGNVKQ